MSKPAFVVGGIIALIVVEAGYPFGTWQFWLFGVAAPGIGGFLIGLVLDRWK